jgi:hypothetical protein
MNDDQTSTNTKKRKLDFLGPLAATALGTAGGAGAGFALHKLTDPYKGYKGTAETVKNIKPSTLRQLRLHALGRLQPSYEFTENPLAERLRVAIQDLEKNKPIKEDIARLADAEIHSEKLISRASKRGLIHRVLPGAAIGALLGSDIYSHIKKRKDREKGIEEEHGPSVGEVLPYPALGAAGGAGIGYVLGRISDPYKGYKGTVETVKNVKPRHLLDLREKVLNNIFGSLFVKPPSTTDKFIEFSEELANSAKTGKPLREDVARFLDEAIHVRGKIPELQKFRRSRWLWEPAALGALAGLGAYFLRHKRKNRDDSTVGRVASPTEHQS